MFECHACLWRHLRACLDIAAHRPAIQSRKAIIAPTYRALDRCQKRYEHTLATATTQTPQAPPLRPRPNHAAANMSNARDAFKSEGHLLKQKEEAVLALKTPHSKDDALNRNIKRELIYLKDPVKLAERVAAALKRNEEEKALALCRLSGRDVANVVSWNHLIDWQMSKDKVKAALQTYNEMKKRALNPDSYTFLLLLRGLAAHAHYPSSLGRALSLYHGMSSPRSKLGPSILHTNAVLQVCSRSKDMDSMWDIVGRLPEKGTYAADNWTFTILLNSIRADALVAMPTGEAETDGTRRLENSIVKGRRVWDIIIRRWRAGDLRVDEVVVCAMGRLLLLGSRPRDWDDVLSLVQQTMNISRLTPRLGSSNKHSTLASPSDMSSTKRSTVDKTGISEPRPGSEFDSQASDGNASEDETELHSRNRSGGVYATPGNNTLSLLLEACLKLGLRHVATGYWELLAPTNNKSGYGIKPDLDNLHMYMRILRQAGASRAMAELLCDDFQRYGLTPQRKSFRIAISACSHDRGRSKVAVFESAKRILDSALNSQPDPDMKLFLRFAELAHEAGKSAYANVNGDPRSDDNNDSAGVASARAAESRILCQALEQLQPAVVNAKSFITFGLPSTLPSKARSKQIAHSQTSASDASDVHTNAAELFRKLVIMYNRVLELHYASIKQGHGGEILSEAGRRNFIERRNRLMSFLVRQLESWDKAGNATKPEESVTTSSTQKSEKLEAKTRRKRMVHRLVNHRVPPRVSNRVSLRNEEDDESDLDEENEDDDGEEEIKHK